MSESSVRATPASGSRMPRPRRLGRDEAMIQLRRDAHDLAGEAMRQAAAAANAASGIRWAAFTNDELGTLRDCIGTAHSDANLRGNRTDLFDEIETELERRGSDIGKIEPSPQDKPL